MHLSASPASVPRAIWALGLVSLFMDASSEMVHSLLPIYLVTTMGASITSVGIIEGIAEATALIVKIFSGTISDLLGRRKLLTVIGYGMAASTKPMFPLADTVEMVFAARFIDRIGKGIRGAPRDALIGDLAPSGLRGTCFGLRQSLDTVGACLGPILAMLFMAAWAGNIRAVLWFAVVPAFVAVAVLILGVREPERGRNPGQARSPIRLRDICKVGPTYWWLVVIAGVLTLARFSEAFLILKARAIGLPDAYAPVVMVLMNLVYASVAYPAGVLSDRVGRPRMLLVGVAFLYASHLVLGIAGGILTMSAGVALWGLHLGFSQGLLAAMITDCTPAELRGTAFGVLNLACGIAMLAASVIAGVLWDHYGPAATFHAGVAFTGVVMIGLTIWPLRDEL